MPRRRLFRSTRLSRAALLAALPLLAACSATAPQSYVVDGRTYRLGKDVACLEQQTDGFHVSFYRAMAICDDKVPDLTGDGKLQRAAWAWQIPFTINPAADAAIKRKFPYTPTGSLIANVSPDRNFVGGPYD